MSLMELRERVEVRFNTRKPLYYATMVGYCLGLLAANASVILTKGMPMPALLFICPAMVVCLTVRGFFWEHTRSGLRNLLDIFNFDEEFALKASSDAQTN